MVEFLRKFENPGIKIARVNSYHQIYQFTLILYDVGVLYDRVRLSVHRPFIEKYMVGARSTNTITTSK